jgi:hypothetical protein
MKRIGFVFVSALISLSFYTVASSGEKAAVERAVTDYIQSQHDVLPGMMARGIDESLAKRTYWQSAEGEEILLETSYDDMVKLASFYNEKGDKFPEKPRIDIDVYDIDKRVASVKLTADDWIDYMHLYKNDKGQWKVINVLWQFNDINAHTSKRS